MYLQLEEIDDELEEKEIELVKCSDRNIEKEYGFGFTPVLVHFHAEVPSIYRGDLEESNEILLWLLANLEKSEIDEVRINWAFLFPNTVHVCAQTYLSNGAR